VVTGSPIEQLIGAFDELDREAAMALLAPDTKLLSADGRRAEGTKAVRELMTDFFAALRSSTHLITAQWHEGDVWIAEIEASYELEDRVRIGPLPRAFIVRDGPHGIAELRVYGANERRLADEGSGEDGMWLSGRWLPPL
jgi:hypothetical protein